MSRCFLVLDRNKKFSALLDQFIRQNDSKSEIFMTDKFEDAKKIIRIKNIDVVFCEEKMNHLQKYYHLSEFKKVNPSVQIIVTSSFPSPDFQISSVCLGAKNAIIKPVSRGVIESVINDVYEILEFHNKKTLLVQDIKMLTKEGQIFPISNVKSLMISIENRHKSFKGSIPYLFSIFDSLVPMINLTASEEMIFKLAILFYGAYYNFEDKYKKTQESTNAAKMKQSSITIENIGFALELINKSLSWYNKTSTDDESTDDREAHLSRILAVLLAIGSLRNYFRTDIDSINFMTAINRFTGTRFDPAVTTLFSDIDLNLLAKYII